MLCLLHLGHIHDFFGALVIDIKHSGTTQRHSQVCHRLSWTQNMASDKCNSAFAYCHWEDHTF